MRFYQRHQLTILLLVAACCQLCHAAEIERLALVSAIGDTMSVVAYRPGIGSQLDQNTRQIVALPDSTFDDTAIEVAKAAVKRLPAQFLAALGPEDACGRVAVPAELLAVLRPDAVESPSSATSRIDRPGMNSVVSTLRAECERKTFGTMTSG